MPPALHKTNDSNMYIEDDTIALALLKYCEEIARSDQDRATLHLLQHKDAYILVYISSDNPDAVHKAEPHEGEEWADMYSELTAGSVDVQCKVYWEQFVDQARKEEIDIPDSDDPIHYQGENREELIGGNTPIYSLYLQITPDRIRLVTIHEANKIMRSSALEGVLFPLSPITDMRKLRSWTLSHLDDLQRYADKRRSPDNNYDPPQEPELEGHADSADDLVDAYRQGLVCSEREYDDRDELARDLFEAYIEDGYYTTLSNIQYELELRDILS